MATGKSPLARNYDKILAAIAVALLAGAIFCFISAKGSARRDKESFDNALKARAPAHPALDRDAATASARASREALLRMAKPFQMAADPESSAGFFVPEVRVWCVKCRKPIPFSSEKCPLCGVEQPKKSGESIDATLDTDTDGIPDIWEREHGFNPLAADSDLDFDGDGFTNLEEFLAGTDPRDKGSHPDLMGFIRVASVETAHLPLVFKSEIKMAGDKYKCQFNYIDKELGNRVKSLFVDVGELIGPLDRLPGTSLKAPPRFADFRLAALEHRDETFFDKIENREKTRSVPVAIVERVSTGRKIEFMIDKESTDSVYVVVFVQTHDKDNTEYTADGSAGEAVFDIAGEKFLLVGVDGRNGPVTIRRLSDKKEFVIQRLE